jgi:RNA polymerase sigma-70 factor (ECF subfamily)
MNSDSASENLAHAFMEHRGRLMALVKKNLNPILLKRMSYEDVLQSAYEAAAKRLDYFDAAEDVPIYFKLRTILLQTIADLSRRHLQSEGRDAYKEVKVRGEGEEDDRSGGVIENLAADVTSPVSRVDRDERHALLRRAVDALAEADRQIIVLRHFDDFGNSECAEILGIEPKAASIRYVRALERLQKKLMELSCFRKA